MNQLGVVMHCKGYLKRSIHFLQCSIYPYELYLIDNQVPNLLVATSAHLLQII
uniref:Uncharacterized protein n=1 Tax=Arundo donax TaxID=35708 RepID=A0A0A9F4Z3_ARUDO